MADPKKVFGGLGKMGKRLLSPEEVAGVRARGFGVPGVDFADPVAPASMRLSEALGNAGAEGKTLNFTEADRSRVQGQNRGGVGFPGLQHYSKPHKKANTVWGFGNTNTAEKKIRQNDPENSLWTTFVGSPTQHRSNSVVIGDAIKEFQKSVKQGVVPVEQIMLMNKRLNELTDLKTGAKVFQNGFDLTDPSALSVANTFARRSAVGDVMLGLGVKGPMARLDFKNEFPGTKFVDGSNIENILKRETDPDLVDANTYDVGNRLFVMDGKIIQRPDLNEAFPDQVTGYDLGMKYGLVPPNKAMRDFYKAREGRLDKNQQPSPVGYYDLARVEPSQVVDEDYLTFLQKEGYKEGGAVDMDAADARLAQAIQARMAKGGSVDMEAADARLEAAINARMAGGGGAFKKIEFMAGGGKLKALGDIGKKFLSDDQVASQAIGKAAESAGMKAPVTANKPLTNLQDVYTSLGDRVNQGAVEMQNLIESMPYKYDKGQRVFTADSVKKNKPPYTILRRVPYGNQPMREDHPNLQPGNKIGKPIIDPATGKTQRTPYEPGYHVRHDGGDGWTEFQIPESAIKGDVEMARGGLLHMADAGRVFKGVKSIGKRFMADPAESSVASARRGERTADQIGGLNIVKETGGNFLTGRTEKDLSPLKRNVTTRAIENGRYTPEQVAQLAGSPRVQANDALNNWIDSNLTNYVEKQMGTANDPVRLMFDKRAQEIDAKYAKDIAKSDRISQKATKELDPRKQANLMREAERIKAEANIERQIAVNHISHKPSLLQEYSRTAENVKKQRMEAGFSEEGVGQSPIAKAWERASDEAIATHRAGDIQGMPENYTKLTEAENKLRAARENLDYRFEKYLNDAGINELGMSPRQVDNLMRLTSLDEKAKMVGDTEYLKASAEYQSLQSPMMDNYMGLKSQNPWIEKVAPETQVYAPFTGDLGFDHIMDVLREDLTTGRIRPDQLSKVNMEQAVRRTSEYDQELAAKMNASRAAAREGLPTYREYPEGYKWIELNKPGAFAQESEAMGHSVRGYEPPKGHPDWTEASGNAGSSSYGHGGWEAIKSGKAKVYSLVDSKGAPHATVEVRNQKEILNARQIPDDVMEQLKEEGKRIGNQKADAAGYGLYGEERLIEERTAIDNLKNDWVYSNPVNKNSISQIKGKGNRAPNEEYLPYVQDFVKGGQWSDVGDIKHTGLSNVGGRYFTEPELVEAATKYGRMGVQDTPWEVARQRHIDAGVPEEQALENWVEGFREGRGRLDIPPEGMAQGGAVHMGLGGLLKLKNAVKGAQKVLPAAERDANLNKMLESSKVKERLYHATPQDIKEFKPGGKNPKVSGHATWLSNDPKRQPAMHNISGGLEAEFREGTNVMPVYVQAKNPMLLDDKDMLEWAQAAYAGGSKQFPQLMPKKWADEVSKDYDSVILADPFGLGDAHEVIMFDPKKIKSATGNRGTYDITDPDISKAEGGPAFKKLQFMDKGGLTTSGGTFSPEELGVTEDDLGINKKFLNNIKRNASEMYDEGKKTLSDDYDRLKASAIARAQLAKIAAAQFAGGLPDLASLVTPLVNSDALLSAFPMARAAKIGLTGSPSTGRRTSVLSDEKTPYSLADYTNDINGNPRGGSEDIIKRAQKAGLLYGGTRMMYDAQEPDPSKEMLTMTPKEYEKYLNSEGRNRINFGEQITTGRFSPVTEIGTAILGGNLGSKLARGAVNTGQKFKKGFDRGHARAMSRQAPPFLRELEYAPSKMRGGLTQLKAR